MTRKLLILCIALTPLTLAAQTIYKCTDAAGGVLISNSRVNKNCQAIVSEEHAVIPAPRAPAAKASANPTPAGFPRVQEGAQKARDNDRRHILEQELAGEQRNLDQARKELAEQEAMRPGSVERTASYRDRVAQFERNIQAIQKELTNLR
ncbi:DUF4124 domain-containing protein [Azonexus sp.]|uniref:DUF4124 domain-containing protein n=1 Tax=Azonexus sp. TaxID=1872668 RepID=UPI0027B9CDD1|nr:DUF4124 domain-containing protein [Azonexus sp.]